MKYKGLGFLGLLSLLVFTGCSSKNWSKKVDRAEVNLVSRSGSKVNGQLALEDHYGGILVQGKISGLKPNKQHGFHIHEKGDCSAADAASAGSHFMIGTQNHGALGGEGAHAGDLGNIKADAKGVAEVNLFVKGLSVKKGDAAVLGRSFVVHADADDLKSQPAGNSGKRIACGVVEASKVQCMSSVPCKCENCMKKAQCGKSDCGASGKDCCGKAKCGDCPSCAKKAADSGQTMKCACGDKAPCKECKMGKPCHCKS